MNWKGKKGKLLIWMFYLYREVMLEKQLTGHRVDRSICAWFWDQVISQGDSFKVPTCISRKSNCKDQL